MKVVTLLLMMISACVIFFGIFLVSASYCFYTVQGLEVRNVFTDGGKHMAQYPIGVFSKGFVLFFTFIIPYAFVNYYPLLYFLGKSNNIWYAFSPIIVILYLIPCVIIFYLGLKRYASVGS
jgi:ABC-2 type transport system permease protein